MITGQEASKIVPESRLCGDESAFQRAYALRNVAFRHAFMMIAITRVAQRRLCGGEEEWWSWLGWGSAWDKDADIGGPVLSQ